MAVRRHSLILFAFAWLPACLAAQGSADVPLGDNAYVYLDALLARGAMRSLSALERPYNVREINRALARAVYRCNDERAAIKKRVNIALGSRIIEEKSYRPYA